MPFRTKAGDILYRHALTIACCIGCLAFIVVYLNQPGLPSNLPGGGKGWWGSWDQGQYYQMTQQLAAGELRAGNYWYGYPILGALFYWVLPLHPFLLPTLAIFVGMIISFYIAFKTYVGRVEAATMALLVATATPLFLRHCVTIPWNNTPSTGAFSLVAALTLFSRPTRARFIWLALFIAMCFFCRPPDTLMLAILYGGALLFLPTWREKLICGGTLALACTVVLAVALTINYRVYGQPLPPYVAGISWVGFSFSNLPLKIYQMFVDATVLSGHAVPGSIGAWSILQRAPWLLFMIPGAIALGYQLGWRFVVLLVAIASYLLFYLGFNYNSGPDFWSFEGFHYFWFLIPWGTVMTYASIRLAPRVLGKGWLAFWLLLPLAILCLVSFRPQVRDRIVVGSGPTVSLTRAPELAKAEIGDEPGKYTLTLDYAAPTTINAVRVFLNDSPAAYHGTAGWYEYVEAVVDGQTLQGFQDFTVSQNSSCITVSFANRMVSSKPFRHLTLRFLRFGTAKAIEFQTVRFAWAPFEGVRRILRRPNPLVDDPQPSVLPEITPSTSYVAGKGGRPMLSYGWGPIELESSCWSIGDESVIRFAVKPSDLPLKATIGGRTFSEQKTGIFINNQKRGEIVGNYDMSKGQQFSSSFDIKPGDVRDERAILVELRHTKAKRPIDLGMGDGSDTRKMALYLEKIEFSPAGSPAAK